MSTGFKRTSGLSRVAGSGLLANTGSRSVLGLSRITASGLMVVTTFNPADLVSPLLILTIARIDEDRSRLAGQENLLLVAIPTEDAMSYSSPDDIYPPRAIETEDEVILVFFEPTINLSKGG